MDKKIMLPSKKRYKVIKRYNISATSDNEIPLNEAGECTTLIIDEKERHINKMSTNYRKKKPETASKTY